MIDWLGDRVCPMCEKRFSAIRPDLWRYKRRNTFFCSWSCMRAFDKKGEEKMENNGKPRVEVLTQMIHQMEDGKDPFRFLSAIGYKNPEAKYGELRMLAKTKYPELFEKLPPNLKFWRQKLEKVEIPEANAPKRVEIPEKAVVPQVPKPEIGFTEDGVHVRAVRKPVNYEGFAVQAIQGVFGRYDHYTLNGTEYLDFDSNNGEELSMPVGAWKDFLTELNRAAKVLGVEL